MPCCLSGLKIDFRKILLFDGKRVISQWKCKRTPVTCPALVKAYNMYMGGTDKNDQMTKLQRCRRHYKWLMSYGEILCVERIQCLRHTELVQTSHHTREANSDISDVH